MADLPVLPVVNYGQLLSSYGEGLANQENATTNQFTAHANATQIPSQIAQRQAETGNIQSQTAGQDLTNQLSALKLSANQAYVQALKALSNSTASNVAPGADNEKGENAVTGVGGSTQSDDPSFHDDDTASSKMDDAMDAKYRVSKAMTPQEQMFYQAGLAKDSVDGGSAASENAAKWHEQRVANQVAESQKEAQKHWNSSYTVATAPDGQAYSVMHDIDPSFAEHAANVHGADPAHPEKWTKEQKDGVDKDIRKFATMANEKLTQYTGYDITGKEGSLRIGPMQLPPIGGQRQGLTPQQRTSLLNDAMKVEPMPDGHGGTYLEHTYKIQGFANADQYITAHAKAAVGEPTSNNQQTDADGKPVPTSGSGGLGAPGSPGAPATKSHPPSVTTAANTGPTMGQNKNEPAVVRNAPDAPTKQLYRQATVPQEDGGYGISKALRGAGPGTTLPPDLQARQLATENARAQLLKDSGEAVSQNSQALQLMDAADTILRDPSQLVTGRFGKLVAQASAILPGQHVDATNYQEVAKYLYNAAIKQGQGNFTRGLTDKDTSLQLTSLSPNADMTSEAVRNLLAGNRANAQYAIDSAKRVPGYLAAGGDPQLFPAANAEIFNRSKIVNGPEGKPTAAPAPGTQKRPGQETSGSKPTPSAAALAKLKADPSLAPAFKARYGYLPGEEK